MSDDFCKIIHCQHSNHNGNSECSGLVVEYWIYILEVAGSVVVVFSARKNWASCSARVYYSLSTFRERDRKWVVVYLMSAKGWRLNVDALGGGGMFARCTAGSLQLSVSLSSEQPYNVLHNRYLLKSGSCKQRVLASTFTFIRYFVHIFYLLPGLRCIFVSIVRIIHQLVCIPYLTFILITIKYIANNKWRLWNAEKQYLHGLEIEKTES